MNNSTNIYDIDGNIIRKHDDTHKWTIDEVKEKIEYYRNKLKNLAEDDKKAVIYATYMRNLSNYLFILYSQMTPEDLQKQIDLAKKETTDEQIKKAMEDLQKEVQEDDDDRTGDTNITTEIQESTDAPSEADNTDEKPGNDETIGRELGDIHEEGPVTQDDLLVERDVTPDNMDEYVSFEES